MKGLKIIPMFAGLLILSYVGVLFVRNNPNEVIVRFGDIQSPSSALGFVIMTSILVGMIISGILCSFELLVLYVQNQRLKRKLNGSTKSPKSSRLFDAPSDLVSDESDTDSFTPINQGLEQFPEKPKEIDNDERKPEGTP